MDRQPSAYLLVKDAITLVDVRDITFTLIGPLPGELAPFVHATERVA
jgi:hypothetical protein